jgi:hypothetical protein
MTITPLSLPPITASLTRRYLTGTGHASPTATVALQNPEFPLPDHRADRTQGGQNPRPAHQSTVVPSGTDKSDQAAATNSP